MSLKKTIENLLGRQDGIIPLTADIIIANPEKFDSAVIRLAKATTNIASFLESLLLHQSTSMIGGGEFQVEVLADKGVHPMDFSTGGTYPFSYTDEEQSFRGTITLGIKRGYLGSFLRTDHPVFGVDMKKLDFTFHHKGRGDWELIFGKGGNEIDPSGDLTIDKYREVCNGIASPFQKLLKNLGEPQWGSSSNALEIT